MTKHYTYDLNDEEQEILDDFEKALDRGEIKHDPDFAKRKKELERIARNMLNKTRNINIRLSERDLHKLKVKAMEEGIPYQTLASSILHKATTEK